MCITAETAAVSPRERFAGTADALAAGERLLPAAYATTGAGAGAGVGVGAAGGTVAAAKTK